MDGMFCPKVIFPFLENTWKPNNFGILIDVPQLNLVYQQLQTYTTLLHPFAIQII